MESEMRKLTYLKIATKLEDLEKEESELKQLWYGLEDTYSPIADSDDFFPKYNEVYSGYTCENRLVYASEPNRDYVFTLHNEDIETALVPEATFSFSYVNADIYSKLIQIFNTKGFYVQYYDYEIMQDVIRYMYMTEKSLDSFHNVGKSIKGFINVKVTFASKIGYKDYEDLKKKLALMNQ